MPLGGMQWRERLVSSTEAIMPRIDANAGLSAFGAVRAEIVEATWCTGE
jgi:hypothetical protein